MPFIINNIDTLMTVASITIKVLKFISQALHYILLLAGAALILTGYWLVTVSQHFAGKTQTVADVAESVHGPVLIEYAVIEPLTPENYMAGVLSTYSLPKVQGWALEDLAVTIALDKPARRSRVKKAASIAA